MLLFRKATGTRKQTKPKIRAFTLRCVYNEFIAKHTVSVGLIILASVHIPHQKGKKWEHYVIVQYLGLSCLNLLFNTWEQLQCAWHSVHDINSLPHSGSLIAGEANRGEGNVN